MMFLHTLRLAGDLSFYYAFAGFFAASFGGTPMPLVLVWPALCFGLASCFEGSDATIVAERPKIGPHMPAIRASLAETLGVSEEVVNVKAKTNERMDAVGRMEGMMAQAVVLMSRMA